MSSGGQNQRPTRPFRSRADLHPPAAEGEARSSPPASDTSPQEANPPPRQPLPPDLASLTTHPTPGNIAAIRRVIATCEQRIQATAARLPVPDAANLLLSAALYTELPDCQRKREVRQRANRQHMVRSRCEEVLATLRARKQRLEEALRLVNRPAAFAASMASTIEYLKTGNERSD